MDDDGSENFEERVRHELKAIGITKDLSKVSLINHLPNKKKEHFVLVKKSLGELKRK